MSILKPDVLLKRYYTLLDYHFKDATTDAREFQIIRTPFNHGYYEALKHHFFTILQVIIYSKEFKKEVGYQNFYCIDGLKKLLGRLPIVGKDHFSLYYFGDYWFKEIPASHGTSGELFSRVRVELI